MAKGKTASVSSMHSRNSEKILSAFARMSARIQLAVPETMMEFLLTATAWATDYHMETGHNIHTGTAKDSYGVAVAYNGHMVDFRVINSAEGNGARMEAFLRDYSYPNKGWCGIVFVAMEEPGLSFEFEEDSLDVAMGAFRSGEFGRRLTEYYRSRTI